MTARNFKRALTDAAAGPTWVRRLSALSVIGPGVRQGYARWHQRRRRQLYRRLNRPAAVAFARLPLALSPVQARVARDLEERGMARVDIRELLGGEQLWAELRAAATEWLASDDVRTREQQYLAAAKHKGKDYLIRLFGRRVDIPWESAWLRFALEPAVLDTVNTYLRMMSKVIYVDLWNTVPLRHAGPDIGSQKWHRDPEDARLVKVFLYLSDVPPGAGPMEYVPHSRAGERYGALWPQAFPAGSIPPADEFERAVPLAARELCAYGEGTLLFVDTAGFHRGGRAEHIRRVVATWTFATQACAWPRAFAVTGAPGQPDERARFALLTPEAPDSLPG